MAVSGILGWLNIRRLALRVTFPDEVYSDADTLITVHLHATRSILPNFLIRAHLFGRIVDFPVVEKIGASAPLMVRFSGRGRKGPVQCRVSSIFPVNFFTRFASCHIPDTLIVFPSPRKCASVGSTGIGREGGAETILRGYEGDVAKIGDYTGTEPQKLIHWRLSARHEEFKVKEMTVLSAEPVILDLALIQGANLEERLSHAVYIVNRLIRENRPVGMKIGDRLFDPAATRAHRLLLLRELALYD